MIDLSGMKRVEVDADKRIARAETGSLVRCPVPFRRAMEWQYGQVGSPSITTCSRCQRYSAPLDFRKHGIRQKLDHFTLGLVRRCWNE